MAYSEKIGGMVGKAKESLYRFFCGTDDDYNRYEEGIPYYVESGETEVEEGSEEVSKGIPIEWD